MENLEKETEELEELVGYLEITLRKDNFLLM